MNPFGWYRALLRNPQYRWIAILGSLFYLISPIDLSPDVVPLLGQIDDVVIIMLLFSELSQQLLGGSRSEQSGPNFSSPNNYYTYETDRQSTDDPNVKTVDVKAEPIQDRSSKE